MLIHGDVDDEETLEEEEALQCRKEVEEEVDDLQRVRVISTELAAFDAVSVFLLWHFCRRVKCQLSSCLLCMDTVVRGRTMGVKTPVKAVRMGKKPVWPVLKHATQAVRKLKILNRTLSGKPPSLIKLTCYDCPQKLDIQVMQDWKRMAVEECSPSLTWHPCQMIMAQSSYFVMSCLLLMMTVLYSESTSCYVQMITYEWPPTTHKHRGPK